MLSCLVFCHFVISFSVMQAIVSSIMMNDVVNPIKLLLNERRKQKTQGKARFRSMYREIMFLSLVALGPATTLTVVSTG